jgi:hypothetical protein
MAVAAPIQQQPVPVTQQAQPEPEPQAKVESAATAASPPAGEERDADWSKSWSKLNQTETTAVKQTLLKVRRSAGSEARPVTSSACSAVPWTSTAPIRTVDA